MLNHDAIWLLSQLGGATDIQVHDFVAVRVTNTSKKNKGDQMYVAKVSFYYHWF